MTRPAKPGLHFAWWELLDSAEAKKLGIANEPTPEHEIALVALTANSLDLTRIAAGRPVRVTSGYRSPALNAALPNASKTSQHMLGEAADIKVAGMTGLDLATLIATRGIAFDQLIWYAPERGGHVHISYTAKRRNRQQTLHAPAGSKGFVPWTSPLRLG